MLDHLILYENFCSSSEFCSLCYFSACAISFFSHSARFFRLYFNLPSSFFLFLCVRTFFISHLCIVERLLSLFFSSGFVVCYFSFHYYFAFRSRACFERKKMIGACAAVFISRCISASRRLSFVRCELLINFFVPHSPIMIGLNSAVRIRMFSLYDMPSVASISLFHWIYGALCMRLLAQHNSFFFQCNIFFSLSSFFAFVRSFVFDDAVVAVNCNIPFGSYSILCF